MLLTALALAYEVDPWTPHRVALADALEPADAAFERLLDAAAASAGCSDDTSVLQRRLARALNRLTAHRVRLTGRPAPAQLGYGVYSGWLETDPSIPRVTTGSGGIFASVRLVDGLVLHTAGTASTVRFGEVWLGTDKVDHFLATGFDYYRWSRWGRDPERALRRGERTEQTVLGRWTSGAFSYADLAANWDGYRFYADLFGPDAVFQVSPEGCVERRGSWTWARWVHPDWDELVNPSVYGARIRRRVQEQLAPERDALCSTYHPTAPRFPTSSRAPRPGGPLGLDGFCNP